MMKLQEMRLERGLSQSMLSKASGVPLQTIQRYEIGYRKIEGAKLETLARLSNALECNIKDLLDDENIKSML